MTNELHPLPNSSSALRKALLAGNATVTLRGVRTQTRFTYQVQQKKGSENGPWFVKVLTGADNLTAYTFLGTIFADGAFRHSSRSSIGVTAPSHVMFKQVWARVLARFQAGAENDPIAEIEVFHMGQCLRCGRALTTPESVTLGLGPDCATKD